MGFGLSKILINPHIKKLSDNLLIDKSSEDKIIIPIINIKENVTYNLSQVSIGLSPDYMLLICTNWTNDIYWNDDNNTTIEYTNKISNVKTFIEKCWEKGLIINIKSNKLPAVEPRGNEIFIGAKSTNNKGYYANISNISDDNMKQLLTYMENNDIDLYKDGRLYCKPPRLADDRYIDVYGHDIRHDMRHDLKFL